MKPHKKWAGDILMNSSEKKSGEVQATLLKLNLQKLVILLKSNLENQVTT